MDITIRDVFKTLLKHWYIVLAITCIAGAVGIAMGVKDYNTTVYNSTASYLFLDPTLSNINHTVNARSYLQHDYIKYQIDDMTEEQYGKVKYEINITTSANMLTIKATSINEDLTLFIVQEYGKLIMDEDNPILTENLTIKEVIPPNSREEDKSMQTVAVQAALFGLVGVFIGTIIVLTPLYNERGKILEQQRKAKYNQ